VCPFDALSMGADDLPVVDEEKCTGCGKCVEACPRGIITLIPKSQEVYLGCISQDFGKAVKSVCKVGCIGCGLCAREKIVENEIITMEGKLPVIHTKKSKDLLKDLEQAVEKCPNSCFVVRVKQEKKKEIKIEKEVVP
ncbi:MAG: 4Fe-4S binding protein, partial [bacterium]